MNITFDELRRIKHALPTGSVSKIASELDIEEQTVRNYFGKSNGSITIENAYDFAEAMLTEAHVGTVSGAAFGADQCVRISYAASDENIAEAVRRIKACLQNFK